MLKLCLLMVFPDAEKQILPSSLISEGPLICVPPVSGTTVCVTGESQNLFLLMLMLTSLEVMPMSLLQLCFFVCMWWLDMLGTEPRTSHRLERNALLQSNIASPSLSFSFLFFKNYITGYICMYRIFKKYKNNNFLKEWLSGRYQNSCIFMELLKKP